jgi:hypothetical protein
MTTTMKNRKTYKAPSAVVCEIRTERGFLISGGSTIEQVGGRAEEEEWLEHKEG